MRKPATIVKSEYMTRSWLSMASRDLWPGSNAAEQLQGAWFHHVPPPQIKPPKQCEKGNRISADFTSLVTLVTLFYLFLLLFDLKEGQAFRGTGTSAVLLKYALIILNPAAPSDPQTSKNNGKSIIKNAFPLILPANRLVPIIHSFFSNHLSCQPGETAMLRCCTSKAYLYVLVCHISDPNGPWSVCATFLRNTLDAPLAEP